MSYILLYWTLLSELCFSVVYRSWQLQCLISLHGLAAFLQVTIKINFIDWLIDQWITSHGKREGDILLHKVNLRRARFDQIIPDPGLISCAGLPEYGDCYLMHKMESGGCSCPYGKSIIGYLIDELLCWHIKDQIREQTQKLINEVANNTFYGILLWEFFICMVWCGNTPRISKQATQHSDLEVNKEEAHYQITVALMRVCTNGR